MTSKYIRCLIIKRLKSRPQHWRASFESIVSYLSHVLRHDSRLECHLQRRILQYIVTLRCIEVLDNQQLRNMGRIVLIGPDQHLLSFVRGRHGFMFLCMHSPAYSSSHVMPSESKVRGGSNESKQASKVGEG